ncbi:M60 family metallopeptidase [Bacillus thuringiensis]|uniref:Peptidase M60 n=1 Tax=Bacillus thuringiensis TaxID=1428 RepID=A0A9X6WT81_BACTU|nr:M60 family metallopeptidase [Bacillus thuringiensis]MED3350355.1 M60 family metallopeptidase [Bacillus thuringiensis]MRB10619.1 peptidase M60 [Bacillus thuringiensis]OTW88676.1 peptidase M60 [Bacillus thuringiensis serovar sumiyoshiensis]OTX05385.1 peptidase M60 [Bacillus thuringiensis serovar fukuokaensis]PEB11403.1 peptidase M60 [Bacillus thuringiensis]
MSKKKSIRVLVAGICISTLLSPLVFEASKGYAAPLEENKGGNLEESKGNKFEQRVFRLPGKGNVEEEKERLKQKWNLSVNEPTGIYAKENEEINIEIKGDQSIKAFIGTRAYDKETPTEFDLKPGKNVILSPNGGVLYFYNLNDTGEVTATVTSGGSHFPLFILGKHTKKDWDEMLKKYKNPYAVELKGERSLITASYESVQKYMKDTDPKDLMKAHDKAIRIENALSGLSEDGVGVAKAGEHYVQFIEAKYPLASNKYAFDYYTGYPDEEIQDVLDIETFKHDGWGAWHEVGHLHQQVPWNWKGMGETTVNIYSLAVQIAFGNKSRMEVDKRYDEAFEYLNQPADKKNFDKSDPIIMFWQLHLIYGDQFYPKLHQMYRVLSDADYPLLDVGGVITDREKKQLFIYMASKAAGQNLISYFAKWGLHAEADTIEKVNKLQLPEPKNKIWLSRDNNPIREMQVKPYKVPYGEAVNTVPDLMIGTDFDEKKASELVQNLGENVKVSGKIRWSKHESGKQTVHVELIDKNENLNSIPVSANVVYGDSIMFFGTWYGGTNIKSIVTLNHEEKKFSTTNSEGPMHTLFADEKYMEMTVYDKTGKEKKAVSVKASENTKVFAEQFNGITFEYGDIVKVYQREFDRFKVYKKNELVDTEYGVHEVFFKVTEQGFERMETLQEVKAVPQKVVIGTNSETLDAKKFVEVSDGEVVGFVEKMNTTKIGEQKVKVETKDRFGNKKVTEVPVEVIYGDSIMFFGTWHGGTNIKSIITLNHEDKKLSTVGSEGPVHTYFKGEKYMGLTVFDKDGKEKKQMVLEGMENTKAFAEQFNGMSFEYGDVVKVYQAEFDRFKVYKSNILNDTTYGVNDVFFKIKEQGFERTERIQEKTV